MPEYAVHINKRGEDTVKLAGYGKNKRVAREGARRMAEQSFPDCRITGSAKTSDAFVAMRGDQYEGTVSVERMEES